MSERRQPRPRGRTGGMSGSRGTSGLESYRHLAKGRRICGGPCYVKISSHRVTPAAISRARPAPPLHHHSWRPVVAVESLPMSAHSDPETPVFALHRGGKIEVVS